MSRPLRALIIENEEDDVLLIAARLKEAGFELQYTVVDNAADLRHALAEAEWDVLISDYLLVGFTALDALEIYKQSKLDVPFLIVSGSIGEETAVEAMRSGAHDYLLKDRLARLGVAVERELREADIRRANLRMALERERTLQELALKNNELASRSEQLYRSNQDLERFAFLAAHDLREPLRMISTYSQLLTRRYGSKGEAENELVRVIVRGVNRMEDLIQASLTYSRLTHHPERNPNTVDANAVLDDIVGRLKPVLDEHDATLEIQSLPHVFADAAHLSQIFENLVSNALKYHRPGIAPHIVISGEERDNTVIFRVKDNGIGIAPHHYDRIFVLFQRLHHADEYPGVGIGLALSKRLVESNGGQIGVESALGEGSTFYFTMPSATREQPGTAFSEQFVNGAYTNRS